MYKNKKNGLVGIIVMIGILTILVITTNGNVNKFSGLENIFNKIVTPIQNGLVYLKNKMANNDSFFENIDTLKAENENLRKQNEELQTQLNELQLIKSENKILREYANLAEEYSDYTTVGAYIINKNTKKFHLPTCSSIKDTKPKNKKESTQTKEELEELGYSPCKLCLD